jgi:tRNA-splicing ligase RtcB
VGKGATPAALNQWDFVGGSMGDDAVILDEVQTPEARSSLYSTVHGVGRRFARAEMDAWL